MPDDLKLEQLEQFCGTEKYHAVMGLKATDGVAYIMQNGYSWFVTDAAAVIMVKLKGQEFLSVKLAVKGTTAKMIITDGNDKILYTQDYKQTDAKRDLNLYCTNGVIMLSGEY